MPDKKKGSNAWGDEYSIWRDYSNTNEVDDMPTPTDYADKQRPVGQGSEPMTVKPDRTVPINWFRGKKKKK